MNHLSRALKTRPATAQSMEFFSEMTVRRLAAIIITLLCYAGLAHANFTAEASSTQWSVVQTSGKVVVAHGGANYAVDKSTRTIPVGAILSTGSDGRIVLKRGKDSLSILSNSRVHLKDNAYGAGTTIFQELGDVLFKVGKQSRPHFQVDTPLLAAVVKGTVFTVHVDDNGAQVIVTEGAVEVATEGRQSLFLTRPNHTASVVRDRPQQIDVIKGGKVVRSVVGTSLGESSGSDYRAPNLRATYSPAIYPADYGRSSGALGTAKAVNAASTQGSGSGGAAAAALGLTGTFSGDEPTDHVSDSAQSDASKATSDESMPGTSADNASARKATIGDNLSAMGGLRKQLNGISGTSQPVERSKALPVTNTQGSTVERMFRQWPILYFVVLLAAWFLAKLIHTQIKLSRRNREGSYLGD